MHICCIDMRRMGEFRFPKLFMVIGYTIYLRPREDGEPIHIQISKEKPTPNAIKIWFTRSEILINVSFVFPYSFKMETGIWNR